MRRNQGGVSRGYECLSRANKKIVVLFNPMLRYYSYFLLSLSCFK